MLPISQKLAMHKLAILALCFCPLLAQLQDHFKPALNKGSNHSMREIDFIYMINLDQRPEKFARSAAQLNPYNIHPYRFSAVNGWELSLGAINDIGVKLKPGLKNTKILSSCYPPSDKGEVRHEPMHVPGRGYFAHCLSRGAIGICLSHLSILQDAYDSGYSTIWVMEDDIQIHCNPRLLSDLIKQLDYDVGKNKWDVLFTDRDMRKHNNEYNPCGGYDKRRPNFKPKSMSAFKVRKNASQHFKRIGARFGAHSMIIRRSGIKKLLNFFKKYNIYFPYDVDYLAPPGIKIYCTRTDIVVNQTNSISDNGGAFYLIKK